MPIKIFAFILSVISCSAFSQVTVPHTFVNDNFKALADAINIIVDQVAILQGGPTAFTVGAMSGTYKLINIYSGAQQDGGQLFVQSATSNGTLVLFANGTYTFSVAEKGSKTRLFIAGDPPQLSSSNAVTPDSGSVNGTWSVAQKQLTLSGFPATYTIAAGNRILISTVTSDSSPALLGIDILVRQ